MLKNISFILLFATFFISNDFCAEMDSKKEAEKIQKLIQLDKFDAFKEIDILQMFIYSLNQYIVTGRAGSFPIRFDLVTPRYRWQHYNYDLNRALKLFLTEEEIKKFDESDRTFAEENIDRLIQIYIEVYNYCLTQNCSDHIQNKYLYPKRLKT